MDLQNLPIDDLEVATWNSNLMDAAMLARLGNSVDRFGLVENLVVRPLGCCRYEVLSGNQRFQVLKDLGHATAPCVVLDLGDAQARVLAQALNCIQGEDDLGLKAEMVRQILETLPERVVLALLPETAESLRALASLGKADMAEHLQASERAQAVRLKHLIFQLTGEQVDVVTEALERVMAGVTKDDSSPDRRGTALFRLCCLYLERSELK